MSRGSDTYVGKLRSNFSGTKFTVGVGSKKLTSRVHSGSGKVAHIAYKLNALRLRRMQCSLHTIPASAIQAGDSSPTPTELKVEDAQVSYWSVRSKAAVVDSSALEVEPLVLKNKHPRWHDKWQCWSLVFLTSVKPFQRVRSVNPFQLVASTEDLLSQSDFDKVLLQFRKIGKDMYTMTYRYPLSAFQAFAICLSSFDATERY